MAERRMFAKTIIDSDAFLDMPMSAQALYFHLSMRADDDGFINNPKRIQRMIGASEDDLKILIAKSFIIVFESGVVVIKHWKIHNYIRQDRKHETKYCEEKSLLEVKENGAYTLSSELCQSNVSQMSDSCHTEVRLGKDRIGKDRIGESNTERKPAKHTFGEYKHVRLSDEELEKLKNEYSEELTNTAITYLDEYIEMKGYKAKNHYLCIKKWVISAVKERQIRKPNNKAQELDNFYDMASAWAESEEQK